MSVRHFRAQDATGTSTAIVKYSSAMSSIRRTARRSHPPVIPESGPRVKKRRLGERRRKVPRFKEGKRDRGLVIECHEYRPTARAFEHANTALQLR
jgi:hypothetical protein